MRKLDKNAEFNFRSLEISAFTTAKSILDNKFQSTGYLFILQKTYGIFGAVY